MTKEHAQQIVRMLTSAIFAGLCVWLAAVMVMLLKGFWRCDTSFMPWIW